MVLSRDDLKQQLRRREIASVYLLFGPETHLRDLEWVALRPELVVEVSFDHVSDGRIRHGTKVLRWRDDKAPEDCAFDQLV